MTKKNTATPKTEAAANLVDAIVNLSQPPGNESERGHQAHPDLNRCRTPRCYRALRALAAGPIMREELDRAAGASNSPDIVAALIRAGWNIQCQRLNRTDRDGRPCKPGRYTLQSSQRETAARFAQAGLEAK